VLAVPLAVLVRAALVHAWTTEQVVTFAAVAFVFATMFVGFGRLIVTVVVGRKEAG
jgi:hypothetical protein